jgi:F-type H+-transporting ATPase subunit delta
LALYELAENDNILDDVAGELAGINAMIDNSPDLARMIRSPVISRDDQNRAMSAILEKAGIGDLTRRFVGLVGKNGRLFVLPKIIGAFQGLLAKQRGETAAEVISAKALTKAQSQALEDALKGITGSPVAVSARVDPGLLGGLVVKLGSRMVDSSLKTKLNRLSMAMKGIG